MNYCYLSSFSFIISVIQGDYYSLDGTLFFPMNFTLNFYIYIEILRRNLLKFAQHISTISALVMCFFF